MKRYDFPVWTTQGGGLVRWDGSSFVFVEPPTSPGLLFSVGDRMPDQWSVFPANGLARFQEDADDWSWSHDLGDYY